MLKFLIPFLLIIVSLGLILSGNRMPLILFVFLITLIVVFHSQTRKYFLPFILSLSLIFLLVFNFDQKVKNNFNNFYSQLSTITKTFLNREVDKNNSSLHKAEIHGLLSSYCFKKS